MAPGIQPSTSGALAGNNMFGSGGSPAGHSLGLGGGADSPAHNMMAGLPKIRAAYGKLSDAQGRVLLKALQALQLHERIDWDQMSSAVLPDFRRDTLKRYALAELASWLRLVGEKVPRGMCVRDNQHWRFKLLCCVYVPQRRGGVRCVGEYDLSP